MAHMYIAYRQPVQQIAFAGEAMIAPVFGWEQIAPHAQIMGRVS